MPPKKLDEKKNNGQRDAATPGANMAGTKSSQANIDSFMNTQPPPWFLREMEKMTNVIQSALAAYLNQMDISVEKLEGGQQANTERIAQVEQKCAKLEQSVTSLQQDHDELAKKHSRAEAELRAQLEDQENRQRRKNLRIAGFPEGTEGNNTVAFLEKWLPPILGLSNTPEIERAHRTVWSRPQESGSP